MLAATGIAKRFGQTLALERVNFRADPGEIHAILGENGAGKTTLMNVIAARVRPDAGVVTLDGCRLAGASAAIRAGIATVHQSPMLFERLSWEENLALGGFGARRRWLDLAQVGARARELARRLAFELPPPGATLERRSLTERVRLELLRALSFNPRVLILDEPTGVMAPGESSAFLASLRGLRAEGRAVILITHKLAEARAIADRITVMRHGRVIARTTAAQSDERQLARLMVGDIEAPPPRPSAASKSIGPVFEITELTLEDKGRRVLDRVSLTLESGEIVGLAGVDGNGQSELVEVLAGVRRVSSGSIRLLGCELDRYGRRRLAVIPQDRDREGLVLDMGLWENLMLAEPLRRRMSRRGWLDGTGAAALCRELIARFHIRAADAGAPAGSLSGGNRQRFQVARALAAAPAVLIAHDVCRGLDLAATAEVHHALRDFALEGGAVLMLSSDLDELLSRCDRLTVISRGRLLYPGPDQRDAGQVGLLMAGGWHQDG